MGCRKKRAEEGKQRAALRREEPREEDEEGRLGRDPGKLQGTEKEQRKSSKVWGKKQSAKTPRKEKDRCP